MNKIKMIITIIFTMLLIALCYFFIVLVKTGCEPSAPPRLSNVPLAAEWHGGCEEGFWFMIVSINNNKVRFKIYNDYNGMMVLDADFKPKNNSKMPESKSLLSNIHYFEFDKIVLQDKSELLAIHPAYGGSFMEADALK